MKNGSLLANANVTNLALLNKFLELLPSRVRIFGQSLVDSIIFLIKCNGPVLGRGKQGCT
jgi:hypothetical protein